MRIVRVQKSTANIWLRILQTGCLALGLGVGVGACQPRDDPSPPGLNVTRSTTMAMPGADNRAAAVAASGQHAVVTWTAATGNNTNVYAAVSRDGGRTFGNPVRVNDLEGEVRVSGEQAPRVAIGSDVVVLWQARREGRSTVRMARSTDGGASFRPATTVNESSVDGTRGWASVALDRAGAAHVVWLDARPQAVSPPAPPAPTSAPTPPAAAHHHGGGASTPQNVYHARVGADGSREEGLVAADVCFCCKTSVAPAPDGALYAAWRHIYPPNLRDMAVAKSTDGGRTFGAPVRVSEDGWAIDGCPEDGPSIAVDAAGVLHIAWPTLVTGETTRKAIFYSYSRDGGKTFAPRVQMDDGSKERRPAHPHLTVASGRVVVAWDEGEGDGRSIRLRAIDSSSSGTWTPRFSSVATITTDSHAAYPALAATPAGALVAWTTNDGSTSVIQIAQVGW
jgi:hypothetical protein